MERATFTITVVYTKHSFADCILTDLEGLTNFLGNVSEMVVSEECLAKMGYRSETLRSQLLYTK
jgi:hypothetical protein